MFRSIIPLLVLLTPIAAAAENVAVLPVSYKIYRTAARSSDRASKMEDAVTKTIEKLGMTPMSGVPVAEAAQSVSPGGPFSCADDACLKAVAEKTGADFSVAVFIVDNDGQFDIKVLVTGAEPSTTSPFGTFSAMVKRVSGIVESSLKEARDRKESAVPEPAPEESQTAPETVESPIAETPDSPPPPAEARRNKPVSKAAFFTSLGITLGIGAAYGAMEAIGYSKQKASYTADEAATVNNLKLSSRILLGTLAAGVITTTVLAVFTDFKGDSKKAEKVAIVPAFSEKTGGVFIQGEF